MHHSTDRITHTTAFTKEVVLKFHRDRKRDPDCPDVARPIDISWRTHRTISRYCQCSTTGVPKAVIYNPVYVMMHIKDLLPLTGTFVFDERADPGQN